MKRHQNQVSMPLAQGRQNENLDYSSMMNKKKLKSNITPPSHNVFPRRNPKDYPCARDEFHPLNTIPAEIWVVIIKSDQIINMVGVASTCSFLGSVWSEHIQNTKKRRTQILGHLLIMQLRNTFGHVRCLRYLCDAAIAGASFYIKEMSSTDCFTKSPGGRYGEVWTKLILKNAHHFWTCTNIDVFNAVIHHVSFPPKWESIVLYNLVKLGSLKHIESWMRRKGMKSKLKSWKYVQDMVPGSLEVIKWVLNYKHRKLAIDKPALMIKCIEWDKPNLYKQATDLYPCGGHPVSCRKLWLHASKYVCEWILPYIKAPATTIFSYFCAVAERADGFGEKEKRFLVALMARDKKINLRLFANQLDVLTQIRAAPCGVIVPTRGWEDFHIICVALHIYKKRDYHITYKYKTWDRSLIMDFFHEAFNQPNYNNVLYKAPYDVCKTESTWMWLWDHCGPPKGVRDWYQTIRLTSWKLARHVIKHPLANRKPLIDIELFMDILVKGYSAFGRFFYEIMIAATTSNPDDSTMVLFKPNFNMRHVILRLNKFYADTMYENRVVIQLTTNAHDYERRPDVTQSANWNPSCIWWQHFMVVTYNYILQSDHGCSGVLCNCKKIPECSYCIEQTIDFYVPESSKKKNIFKKFII